MNHPNDIITSGKDFAGFATELLDTEVQQAIQIVVAIQQRYAHRPNTAHNLEQLRDEALTKLAEIGILATLDPAPCLYGDPPVLEIIGKIQGDPLHTDGFDHEAKGHQVRRANSRNEDYLGQKERPNSRRPKK